LWTIVCDTHGEHTISKAHEYKASIHKMGKLLQPHDPRKFKTFQSTKDKKKMTGLFKILSQNGNRGCFEARKEG